MAIKKEGERRELPVNTYGGEAPFDRIAFYHGGALLIDLLIRAKPPLHDDPRALFEAMR